jgi:hypothetical protein
MFGRLCFLLSLARELNSVISGAIDTLSFSRCWRVAIGTLFIGLNAREYRDRYIQLFWNEPVTDTRRDVLPLTAELTPTELADALGALRFRGTSRCLVSLDKDGA